MLKRLDCGVRVEGKDLLDIMIEGAHIYKDDLIVDPVGLAFVHGLHYFIELLLFSLVIVLQEIYHISLLKVTGHPVFLSCVS